MPPLRGATHGGVKKSIPQAQENRKTSQFQELLNHRETDKVRTPNNVRTITNRLIIGWRAGRETRLTSRTVQTV
jgi:hypothetical protein